MNSTIKEYTSDSWQQNLQSVDSGSVNDTWDSINVNFKIASLNTVQRVAPNEEQSSLNICYRYTVTDVPYKFGCHCTIIIFNIAYTSYSGETVLCYYSYMFVVFPTSLVMLLRQLLCFLRPFLCFLRPLLCFLRPLLCFLRPWLSFLRTLLCFLRSLL